MSAEILDTASSPGWADGAAAVSVIIATHNRRDFLDDLFACLSAQTADIEVVVADDGSTDTTWPWLKAYAATTKLPLLALRLRHTGGPSQPRNTAAEHARAAVLAVTDDDCLPEPGWAAALANALRSDARVAQGCTRPVDGARGAWDRAVRVEEPSWLFETCNLAFDRSRFLALGGFPTLQVLARLPRGFGEDVVFGAIAARDGGFAWAPDALVRHRWIATTYRAHLHGVRRLSGFPWLARDVPEVAQLLVGGVFLSRRTAAFDAALVSVIAAAATKRPALLVGSVPWFRRVIPVARFRTGRPVALRLAQEAVTDLVGLGSLVEGSVRHRRVVL
jgi:glycosyltransferase involved in cell wall biosynthesis